MLNANRQQLSDAQAQLENITNNYADLDAQLTAMQGELDSLNADMVNKQSEIESLAKENSDLVSSISELEETLEESAEVFEEEEVEVASSVKSTETAQAVENITTNQQNLTETQAAALAQLESLGITNTAGMGEYTHATDRTSSINDVGRWE